MRRFMMTILATLAAATLSAASEVTISFSDLSPAKQAELKAIGYSTFSATIKPLSEVLSQPSLVQPQPLGLAPLPYYPQPQPVKTLLPYPTLPNVRYYLGTPTCPNGQCGR